MFNQDNTGVARPRQVRAIRSSMANVRWSGPSTRISVRR